MRQNPHVRICGGPGSATTLVYPTLTRYHRLLRGHPTMVSDLRTAVCVEAAASRRLDGDTCWYLDDSL